jgi:NADPH-dependent curcumin reductase CurA
VNRQIILKSRPAGIPVPENFSLSTAAEPIIKKGELKVKAKFISVDPYMRGRMNDNRSYMTSFEIGKPIEGAVLAEVIESRDEAFKTGDLVLGNLLWQEIQTITTERVTRINKGPFESSYYLSILGMPGLTAYFGLLDIVKPKTGETVVVSGAAGAVGMVVGQLALIMGCHVVGIVGTEEKAKYLVDTLYYDNAINYRKSVNLSDDIARSCPNGVDIYFDSVGGEISDSVLPHINKFARIPICGQISLYNKQEVQTGPRAELILLGKNALMQGFSVRNYTDRYSKAIEDLSKWIMDGKLIYAQTITKGFEKLPEAFIGLFYGKNIGKQLVEVE